MKPPSSVDRAATEQQRRNRHWLATHTPVVVAIAAVACAAIGLAYGAFVDDERFRWLSPPVGGALGAVVGGLLGYAVSVENRRPTPQGVHRVGYVGALVVVFLAVAGMRYLRYRT